MNGWLWCVYNHPYREETLAALHDVSGGMMAQVGVERDRGAEQGLDRSVRLCVIRI